MPVLVPDNRRSPSGTYTLSENYRRALQRPLNQLISDIRTGVIDEDVFGLLQRNQPGSRPARDTLAPDDADIPPLVRLDRTERQVDAFDRWLQRRLAEGVLETVDRGGNTYVRSAYARGLKDAVRMVRAQGGDPAPLEIDVVFDMGVHRRTLKRLFQENFEDLEDISRELSRQIRDELTEGLAAGENPRKVARRLTDRVDTIGKTRAETLARTRLLDAYSHASLNQYERMGVETVAHGRWLDSDDDRVCPICKRLDGRKIPIGEARTGTFEIAPSDLGDDEDDSLAGTYPLRPPAHPRGRCVLIPLID